MSGKQKVLIGIVVVLLVLVVFAGKVIDAEPQWCLMSR